MTTIKHVLDKVAGIVGAELAKHLSDESALTGVQTESRLGPDGEDYIHVNIILSDGYPELDVLKVSGLTAATGGDWRTGWPLASVGFWRSCRVPRTAIGLRCCPGDGWWKERWPGWAGADG